MKIRNILALVAVSCMLVFASCKKEKSEIPDHLKIVPANSVMVMTINAKELVEKGGLNKYKDFEIYKKFHEEISRYEPEATKFIDEFLKDTRVTGLDLDKIYMYLQRVGRYDVFNAFTFGVDDWNKVAKWINQFHKIISKRGYQLEDGNGYKTYRLDSDHLLVWDKTKAILLNVREYDEESLPSFESFLKIDEENSIIANADFMGSLKANKDFTFWMPFKRIMELNDGSEEFSMLDKLYGEDWTKASMDISLNFTNEKASFSYSILPASLVEKYRKEYPILKDGFDQSLLNYFPSEFFFASKISFNVQEYYKLVVNMLNKLAEEMKSIDDEDYDDYYGYSDYSRMAEVIAMVTNEDVVKIVSSFKGDLIADIFGFQEGIIPMPKFGIAVTIDGEEAFNRFLGLLPKDIEFTKTDSYYSYSIPQVTTFYAGQRGDVMYITNVKEALDSFFAQGYKDNLSSSSIAQVLKDSPLLYSLNLDINKYPVFITSLLRESVGSMEYNMLSNFIEPFSTLDLVATKNYSAELNLMLKDNKENSLKVLFKAIDRYVNRFMGF
ncbi:MAG: DUF4836 family protein [Prevotellaceae bacterium]|jgi:hypothetical protein|nr:DUF4836 family protein [Prevotellaceae bacterium]